jgi:beta-xylosidase
MKWIVLIILALFTASNVFTQDKTENKIAGYLFAHMTKDDYGSLYYSVSTDGLNWQILNSGKKVNDSYLGHPDICVGHDGRFYMIGVDDKAKKAIIWTSSDLLNWKTEGEIPYQLFKSIKGNEANDSWLGAPKMFFDDSSKRYIITWHSPKSDVLRSDFANYWCSMRTFYMLSSDLRTFTLPARLFSYDMGTIDVIIRKEGDLFYAILKDECEATPLWPTGKSVRVAVAHQLEGPYSYPSKSISYNYHEAPTVIPKPYQTGYYMYTEMYPGIRYDVAEAPSLNGPWFGIYQLRYKVPEVARHGCMISLDSKQYQSITEKYK